MNKFTPRPSRSGQRGAAALAVAMVLLFGITIVAFYTNRGMIFEQRTSVNQYRSTSAYEMAEAGLEWAVSRLNDDLKMVAAPSCATTGAVAESFPDRYLSMTADGFTIEDDLTKPKPRPSCSIAAGGAVTCSCPGVDDLLTVGAADEPRFLIEFRKVTGDPWSVEIVSWGCTNQGAPCTTGWPAPDGQAVVRALYKMKPSFPNAPGAGLVTGLSAVTGGNLRVINLDPKSNGITINSGASVELGTGTDAITLAGTSPRASVLDNDPSLNALTTADKTGDLFFSMFFSETMAEFKDSEKTWVVTSASCIGTPMERRCTTCANAVACGTAISAAYDKGFQRFWSENNASFQNNLPAVGTLGTPTKPISIASPASVELKGALVAYGIIYAATASADGDWNYAGSGNGKILGALVSRGAFSKGGSGTLDLIYDPNLFSPQSARGLMVRVPGSWRDSLNEL